MNKWLDPLINNYVNYFGKTEKPVVWEVGSRDGKDAVEMAERIYDGDKDWFWTNATIVAFEPNPDQAKIIKNNYPEVETFELAASNKNGVANFRIFHGDEGTVGSSSLDMNWKKEDNLRHHIRKVTTVRLEDMVIEPIDIMKIDVEGYSMQVLEGLAGKLDKIKVIHVETEEWTGSDKAVEVFMKNRGWTLVDDSQEWSGMPDQVWVNLKSPVDWED